MKKLLFFLLLIAIKFNTASAQDIYPTISGNSPEVKEQWSQLTPQQQAEIKTNIMATWQNMTPEQKQVLQEQALERWKNMSPDEKAAMREEAMQVISNMDSQQRSAALESEAKTAPPAEAGQYISEF